MKRTNITIGTCIYDKTKRNIKKQKYGLKWSRLKWLLEKKEKTKGISSYSLWKQHKSYVHAVFKGGITCYVEE